MKDTTIISGNYTLKAYDKDGVIFGAEPVKRKLILAQNPVKTGTIYYWDMKRLGCDIMAQTIVLNFLDPPEFVLNIGAQDGATILWAATFTEAHAQRNGTLSIITLPNLIVRPNWELGITVNKDITDLQITCEEIDVEGEIPPTRVV